MAVRTTVLDVKNIISTTLDDDAVNAYISGASALVTEVIGSNTTITDELKEEIERWMTAHMIASTQEQQLKSAKAGSAEAVFQGEWGAGLQSTSYGQMVLALDTTGGFASLGGKSVRTTAIESFD